MNCRAIALCAAAGGAFAALWTMPAHAARSCPVSHADLKSAITAAQAEENGGFGLNMWAAVVDRGGDVCAVAFSGQEPGDQWPGSRVIAAQKANTANAFSLDGLALSTAMLFSATQNWQSLFGLQESNPVDPNVAYSGPFDRFGAPNDPMLGRRIGGVNVFGGGLAIYVDERIVGGVGVSGDTSCADHNIAWRVREILGLEPPPALVDQIIYDITGGPGAFTSASGFGHPDCGLGESAIAVEIGAGVVPTPTTVASSTP